MRFENLKSLRLTKTALSESGLILVSKDNIALIWSFKHSLRRVFTSIHFLVLGTCLFLQSGCGQTVAPVSEPPKTQVEVPKELGPVETFQAMQTRLAEGDMVAIWDALPATYQKDVNTVLQEFAGKMDPELWNQVFGVIGKFQTVATHKKEIMSKMMNSDPQFAKPEDANYALDQALVMIAALNNDKISKLENVKNFDGAVVIKSTLNPLFSALMKLYDKFNLPGEQSISPSEFLKNVKMELVSVDGDKAVVNLTNNAGESSTQTMVKVEGKWIPEDIQKNFSEQITQTKTAIASITPESMTKTKQQVANIVTLFNSTLDTMDKAETVDELKAASMELMAPIMMIGNNLMMGSPARVEPESKSESNPEPEQNYKPKSTTQPDLQK